MRIPFVDLSAQYASLKDEIDSAIQDVISSTVFIRGPAVGRFEQAFADLLGVKHVCGTSSGTEALHMAIKACGIGPGDEVITSVNTWISTAFAASYVSACPVLVDIDPDTYQMDVSAIERAITPRTKAVIPVHLFGHPAPMKAIMGLCRERRIKVIEDVAQAPLAEENGRMTGTIGDVGCFSFYPSKNLGCYGDGGAVSTNDDELAQRLRVLINYGQARAHHHKMIGHNARLDTMQAAILLAKVAHLKKWTAMRRHNAKLYREALSGLPLKLPTEAETAKAVYHIFVVQTDARDKCLGYLNERGIMAQVHYPNLIHLQPCYKELGYKKGDFPVAESIVGRALSLPMYAELSEAQISRIAGLLKDFFDGA